MASSSIHTLIWSPSRLFLCSREDTSRKNTAELREIPLESINDLQGRRDAGWEFHLAIPACECLLGIVDFPGGDAQELAGMVELRMEDVSPFPMDRTYYGWEVLERSENNSRVLYALCPQSVLDRRHDALRECGITLHRADVDLAAWLDLLRAEERREDSCLLLMQDESTYWLIALDRGLPAAILSLGACDEAGDLFLEELDLALSSVEAERGALDFSELVLWELGAGAVPDLGKLRGHLGIPCRSRLLSELPSVGAGLIQRAEASGTGHKLDLSPQTWKDEEAARKARKRLVGSLAWLAGLWVLLTIFLLGFVRVREHQLRKLGQEIASQETPVLEIRALSERVRSLTQFTDRRTSALEILRILAEAAPGSGRVVLKDIQYRKQEGFTISGEAAGDFFLFQESLSASPVLRVEDFDTREARGVTEFRVVGRWRWEGDAP